MPNEKNTKNSYSELSDEDIQHCNVIAVVHPDDISIFYHDGKGMHYQFNISPVDKDKWEEISDFIAMYDDDDGLKVNKSIQPFEFEYEINK